MPKFLSGVDKGLLVIVWKAPSICFHGKFDKYKAVLPLLKALLILGPSCPCIRYEERRSLPFEYGLVAVFSGHVG